MAGVEAAPCAACGSVLCTRITTAASDRWRAQSARRIRAFHDPERFAIHTVDPGTVCQTTRRPIPSRPSRAARGGRPNHAGIHTPAGE